MKNTRPVLAIVILASALSGLLWLSRLPFHNHNAKLAKEVATLDAEITGLHRRLATLSNDAIQVEFPAELMWPEETKADAELSLQKVIVDLASKSGMKATTFNNTLTKRNAQRAIASFNIEMEGVLDDAYAFLAGLEAHQPKIAVGNLRIRPGQLRTGPAKQGVVRVQVDLWIYWSSDA